MVIRPKVEEEHVMFFDRGGAYDASKIPIVKVAAFL